MLECDLKVWSGPRVWRDQVYRVVNASAAPAACRSTMNSVLVCRVPSKRGKVPPCKLLLGLSELNV